MKYQFDIIFSVWNTFFSIEQMEGFYQAGLQVYSIGTRKCMEKARHHDRCFLSASLAWLQFRTASYFLHEASMWAFDKEAVISLKKAKLLWALGGMNLSVIKKAKAWNMPCVLDVGSAHKRQQLVVLSQEYDKWNIKFPVSFYERWSCRSEQEYSLADWITVGSSYVKSTLTERGVDPQKIIVNPYGIRASLWKASYEQQSPRDGKTIFIYTAGIILRKGIQYLVRAWKTAQIKNAELWICGGGDLPWDRICGDLPSTIKFFGRQSHEQLRELYSKAHVYVLPSLLEGLARSGLEAMAAGLPVIVTEETGLTDFVQDGVHGWVIPSANEEALIERLRWCHQNRDLVQQAGERAFELGQKQDFEGYGQRCARLAHCVIAGQDL